MGHSNHREAPDSWALFPVVVLLLCAGAGFLAPPAEAGNPRSGSLAFYGARWSDNYFGELVVFETEFRDSYVWVLAASRELSSLNDSLTLEGEVNVGRHTGLQDHLEYNGLLLARWHTFPWDRHLASTGAFGIGYSYAEERPRVEFSSEDDTERSLAFMALEITFSAPKATAWETFLRIHHRSDAYDLVADGRGSNFLGVGIRHHFAWP